MSSRHSSNLLLNSKIAETLRTMPDKHEFVFSVARSSSVDFTLFVRRFGTLPDGGHQVYSFDAATLETFLQKSRRGVCVASVFNYELCVPPMSPRRIWAVALLEEPLDGPDPLIALHAPWAATDGMLVMQFTDEERMREFVARV